MCKIASLPTVKIEKMYVPHLTKYHYPPNTLVHPMTEMPVADHLWAFKCLVDGIEGHVVVLKDEGRCVGFRYDDIQMVFDRWLRGEKINADMYADLMFYFSNWVHGRYPVSQLDQITAGNRTFTWNAHNWMMYYVPRVRNLCDLVKVEWFDQQVADQMSEFDREIRAQANPVFAPPLTNNVVDLTNDDESVEDTDYFGNLDEIDIENDPILANLSLDNDRS